MKLNNNQKNALNAFIDANNINRNEKVELVNLEQFPYIVFHIGNNDFQIDLGDVHIQEGIYPIESLKLDEGNMRKDILNLCQCILDNNDVALNIQRKAFSLIKKWFIDDWWA